MKNILFVNSKEPQCGCHSYGKRSFDILKKSQKYNFIYCEPISMEEYFLWIEQYEPAGIIYNFHPLTMQWFSGCTFRFLKHYILHHEGTEHTNLNPDYWLYVDSLVEDNKNKFSVPRPLIENHVGDDGLIGLQKLLIKAAIPVISSFGFGFGNKNYGSIIKIVNDQFDAAIIKLHIPRAFYGDNEGQATGQILPGIWNEMKNPNIKLEITHDFLSDEQLLKFLSESSLNIFLYDEMVGRGLSSVIDYSLSVDVPIAINNSYMFRHIQKPEINVANKSLKEIIEQGTEPLKEFKEKWSNDNFIKKYEHILDRTL